MNFKTNSFIIYLYKIIYNLRIKGSKRIAKYITKLLKDQILFEDKKSNIKLILPKGDCITSEILKYGYYEKESISLAKRLIQNRKGVFIDLGSNLGLYTCLLARDTSRTIAIEASPIAFSILYKHILLNNLENQVTLICSLLGTKNLLTGFNSNLKNLGVSRISNSKLDSHFFLPSFSINNILEQTILSNENITLMKIDIEGAELDLINEFDFSIFKPNNIIMEFEPKNNPNVYETIIKLKEKGYQVKNIDGSEFKGIATIENNLWFNKV